MGSLSDLKRTMLAKSDQLPAYYPGSKAANATGLGAAGVGGAVLMASRRLPERTVAARNVIHADMARRIQAAPTKGRRAKARHAQDVARAQSAAQRADTFVRTAPARQKYLRSRGGIIAATGAGLLGYGAYAKRKNRENGYA